MTAYEKKSAQQAVENASKAVAELREAVGLPSGPLAKDISAKIAVLAKEKGVMVEWNIRVIRPGGPVEALCNCMCYA